MLPKRSASSWRPTTFPLPPQTCTCGLKRSGPAGSSPQPALLNSASKSSAQMTTSADRNASRLRVELQATGGGHASAARRRPGECASAAALEALRRGHIAPPGTGGPSHIQTITSRLFLIISLAPKRLIIASRAIVTRPRFLEEACAFHPFLAGPDRNLRGAARLCSIRIGPKPPRSRRRPGCAHAPLRLLPGYLGACAQHRPC